MNDGLDDQSVIIKHLDAMSVFGGEGDGHRGVLYHLQDFVTAPLPTSSSLPSSPTHPASCNTRLVQASETLTVRWSFECRSVLEGYNMGKTMFNKGFLSVF